MTTITMMMLCCWMLYCGESEVCAGKCKGRKHELRMEGAACTKRLVISDDTPYSNCEKAWSKLSPVVLLLFGLFSRCLLGCTVKSIAARSGCSGHFSPPFFAIGSTHYRCLRLHENQWINRFKDVWNWHGWWCCACFTLLIHNNFLYVLHEPSTTTSAVM